MANLMQRVLRCQSCLRAMPRLTPSLIIHQKPCIESVSVEFDSIPLTSPVINVADKSLWFYPSFPIGYGFNPNLINDDSGLIEEKDEKETVIYADSVKKKRKKKMNKHKYRKLRKRLGRKS